MGVADGVLLQLGAALNPVAVQALGQGQGRQAALVVCAVSVLYVPAGHAFCVALVEAAPHQWPALHSPVQAAVVRPVVSP